MNRVSLIELSGRQRRALDLIISYYRATGEPCSAGYLARQMDVHHSTVQQHIEALFRKGWVATPNSPAVPTREA